MGDELKPLLWVGSSQKDLRAFPEDLKDVMGFALHVAQTGGKHGDAKPLTGFGGAGVLEVVDDYDGDTYRAVYTVRFEGVVYVLHEEGEARDQDAAAGYRPRARTPEAR